MPPRTGPHRLRGAGGADRRGMQWRRKRTVGGGSGGGSQAGTFFAAPQTVGGGTARGFVTLDAAAQPTAVGIVVSESALSGLPNAPATGARYNIALPAQAAKTVFDHVALDWNSMGHPPPGIYDTPHFDVHFYTITEAAANAITGQGADLAVATKTPAQPEVPTGYIAPTPDVVPGQGVHWIDPASPEFHGQPFKYTMIYGFYNGHMDFVEPMVTRAFLLTKTDVAATIPQPTVYSKSGYFPTQYRISYDAGRKEYTLTLDGLVQH